MTPKNNSGRIQSIDGWRALAALGVLWTHAWATTNFHSIKIGQLDLFKSINIVGNGVHLFFIISGFCMYLILHNQKEYTFKVFIDFIKKRWLRIAPAFYFACIVIALINFINMSDSLVPRVAYNVVFLQNHLPDSVISSPFWSLAVEWHFYIILPLLFIVINKVGVLKGVIIFSVLSLLFNMLHYKSILLPGSGWNYYLPGNLVHFMWGILLSYVFTSNLKLPDWVGKPFSFLLAFILANVGKSLFSNYGLQSAGLYKWIFLSIGPAVMTLGFCWMIYVSLQNGAISKIVGNKYLARVGKISYSFYLWHSFILEIVYRIVKKHLRYNGFDPIILFGLTLVILLPVSYVSFRIFESFYFNKRVKAKVSSPVLYSTS